MINWEVSCLFEEVEPDKFVCSRCGWETNERRIRTCPKAEANKPALKIATLYAIARSVKNCMEWHLHEIRTPEQIEPLLAVCLDCEDYPCEEKPCTWKKRLACVGFSECERWLLL